MEATSHREYGVAPGELVLTLSSTVTLKYAVMDAVCTWYRTAKATCGKVFILHCSIGNSEFRAAISPEVNCSSFENWLSTPAGHKLYGMSVDRRSWSSVLLHSYGYS